jgi:hypothetical protein
MIIDNFTKMVPEELMSTQIRQFHPLAGAVAATYVARMTYESTTMHQGTTGNGVPCSHTYFGRRNAVPTVILRATCKYCVCASCNAGNESNDRLFHNSHSFSDVF